MAGHSWKPWTVVTPRWCSWHTSWSGYGKELGALVSGILPQIQFVTEINQKHSRRQEVSVGCMIFGKLQLKLIFFLLLPKWQLEGKMIESSQVGGCSCVRVKWTRTAGLATITCPVAENAWCPLCPIHGIAAEMVFFQWEASTLEGQIKVNLRSLSIFCPIQQPGKSHHLYVAE